jgi:hypothetical protein
MLEILTLMGSLIHGVKLLFRRHGCLPIEKGRLWIARFCTLLVLKAFAGAITPSYVLGGLKDT